MLRSMAIIALFIAWVVPVCFAQDGDSPAERLSVKAKQAEVGGRRNITLIEDLDQDYMTTKVYEIKHMKAADLRPFVEGAVRRADGNSGTSRLNYKFGKKQFLEVAMPNWMVPFIDDMIKKLDRPGKKDQAGAIIDGTGIYMFYYIPKYRSTQEMLDLIVNRYSGGDAMEYRDPVSNIFYWKDSASDGKDTGKWLKAIDRPVPQVELTINVYEINENDLMELGIDFVTWKNGPGANIFSAAFDYMDFSSFTDMSNASNMLDIASKASHSWAGFMVAPNIDATFLRILAQKGKAKIATSNTLTIVNDQDNTADTFGNQSNPNAFATARYRIRFQPNYQVITKDGNQQMAVGATNPLIWFYLRNPTINFDNTKTPDQAAIINFGWVLNVTASTVEQTFNGTEIQNTYDFRSYMTLATGSEKLLASYEKHHAVDQDNGVIGLSEIPGLKYIFGASNDSKTRSYVYLTVEAKPIKPDTSLAQWAGKMISDADEMLKFDEDNQDVVKGE